MLFTSRGAHLTVAPGEAAAPCVGAVCVTTGGHAPTVHGMDPVAALMWTYVGLAGWAGLAGRMGAPWLFVDGVRTLWRFWRVAWIPVGVLLAVHAADAWTTATAMDLGASDSNRPAYGNYAEGPQECSRWRLP
jgi:hypothetical protein